MNQWEWCQQYVHGTTGKVPFFPKDTNMFDLDSLLTFGILLALSVFAIICAYAIIAKKRVPLKTRLKQTLWITLVAFVAIHAAIDTVFIWKNWYKRHYHIKSVYDMAINTDRGEIFPRTTYRSVCERGRLARRLIREAKDYRSAREIVEEAWDVRLRGIYFQSPEFMGKWVRATRIKGRTVNPRIAKGIDLKPGENYGGWWDRNNCVQNADAPQCGDVEIYRLEREYLFQALARGLLARAAAQNPAFTPTPEKAAQLFTAWVAGSFAFGVYGFNNSKNSLDEKYAWVAYHLPNNVTALASARGVCSEYSLLLVSLLKSIGIPARIVELIHENSLHVLVEVWYDGQWHLFDPTVSSEGPVGPLNKYLKKHSMYIMNGRFLGYRPWDVLAE